VAVGLVLVVLLGLRAWSRFRRMNRFGRRALDRVSGLAADAGRLADRLDELSDRADHSWSPESRSGRPEIVTGSRKTTFR
jgi:hypothetical protein